MFCVIFPIEPDLLYSFPPQNAKEYYADEKIKGDFRTSRLT